MIKSDDNFFTMPIPMPCPSCGKEVKAMIKMNSGEGTWKCKCGDYGECGLQ